MDRDKWLEDQNRVPWGHGKNRPLGADCARKASQASEGAGVAVLLQIVQLGCG